MKTPKLYFYDVGLAAHLIGITEPGQLRTHPLRGQLFENLIVVEVMKHFLNRGHRPHLYLYRDSNGNEVDLVLQSGRQWVPVEIKSAATVKPDLFKGLFRFMDVVPDAVDPMLVYDGDNERRQSGVHVLYLQRLADALSQRFEG